MSDSIEKTQAIPLSRWQGAATDLAGCLRFYSRLAIPALPWEQDPHGLPDFPRLTRMLPLAGVALGLPPALVLTAALQLGLGPWLAAALAVATATLITGFLHEDGLADTADSLGGATRERRLDIMRDSRIGSFGASALILAFALRIGALAALVDRVDVPAALGAVLIAAALSRMATLMMLVFLPPARQDGASCAVGRPTRKTFGFAAGLAGVVALVIGTSAGLPLLGVVAMMAFSAVSGLALIRFAKRHIGGQTGDMAGAAQQIGEIAALIGLLTVLEP